MIYEALESFGSPYFGELKKGDKIHTGSPRQEAEAEALIGVKLLKKHVDTIANTKKTVKNGAK